MKSLLALLLVITSFSTAFAHTLNQEIAKQARTLLLKHDFNPQQIEVSSPESPAVHIAEAIVDLMLKESTEFREIHFMHTIGAMELEFNCLASVKDRKLIRIYRCKAKELYETGIWQDY